MAFRKVSESQQHEREGRQKMMDRVLKIGISFLDDSLFAIFPDDLLLVGAPSGIGKTQLCCIFAMANALTGKRVHYIALEAGEYEIERRLKYPLVAEAFFADEKRPNIDFEFDTWLSGIYDKQLEAYELHADTVMREAYQNLHIMYKEGDFGSPQLIETVMSIASETDLIIIDHAQYFDFDGDENRGLKEIAKTARTLALEEQKPIILVSHLRKKDKFSDELIPGLEEFHGSSDLTKIATRVVVVTGGQPTGDGRFETFFRVPKNRINGSSKIYSASLLFSPLKGTYESKYQIGWAEQSRKQGFKPLDFNIQKPSWVGRSSTRSRNDLNRNKGPITNHADTIRPRTIPFNPSDR